MSRPSPYGTSIAGALEQIADRFSDSLAIVHGDRTLSWSQFDEAAARLAGFFAESGIRTGDRVAIGCQNRPEYLIAMFAAQKLEATPVNVNFRYRLHELEYILVDSGASVLVHDDALAPLLPELVKTMDAPPLLVSVATAAQEVSSAVPLNETLRSPPQPRGRRDGQFSWVIYTGGTTGRPKAVAVTEESVLIRMGGLVFQTLGLPLPSDPETLWPTLEERHSERLVLLPASPLMHGTGIYGSLNALLAGGTVVLLTGERFDPQELAATLVQRHVTDLHLVGDVFALPLAQTLSAARANGSPYDLTSLKRIQSVGTLWSPSVKAQLLSEANVTLVDLIAATEGGPFAAALATRETDPTKLAQFRLLPGARLIDPTGRDVEPGAQIAGILAAPAQDGAHYVGDAERSSEVFRVLDGTCYAMPGDMAQLRGDGTLRFLGRGSSVINTGGEKVYVVEVEDALRSHADVRDAVVVGVPDPRFGSLVGAVVQPRQGSSPDPEALAEHVAAMLAGYKRPRRIVMAPELRRSAVGKADLGWAREALSSIEDADLIDDNARRT